jgi:hypothetical protein
MAGDWIKMRVNLVTHPKVLAIAEHLAYNDAYQDWSTLSGFAPSIGGSDEESLRDYQDSLRVTRYVTVCALLRFWGYANEHARDEFISTLRISDLDEIVQVPGFGAALEAIGWVEYDKERRGVSLPNFNEYNTSGNERSASAKTAAQRQKEYRDRNKSLQNSDVTRDVTSNRREEKNREEKNIEIVESAPQDKPAKQAKRRSQIPDDFYPNEAGVVAIEKTNLSMAVELTSFTNHHKSKGSLMADWQAAWRLWVSNGVKYAAAKGKPAESFKERDDRNARKRWEEMTGQTHPDNMQNIFASAVNADNLLLEVSP